MIDSITQDITFIIFAMLYDTNLLATFSILLVFTLRFTIYPKLLYAPINTS